VDGRVSAKENYVWRAMDMFARHGDAEAIVAGGRRITYSALRTGVLTMAATLREYGIRNGMAVAALVANPPEAIVLHLALHALGCRSVWVARAPQRHQLDFLRHAQVDAFVYDPTTHAAFGHDCADALAPMPVYCLAPGGVGPDLAAHRPAEVRVDPDDPVSEPVSLFQTSGTTGRPKLVIHRHKLFQALPQLAERWVAEGRPVLRHFNSTGHWHVAAQMTSLMVLCMGGTLLLHNSFEVDAFLDAVARERVTSAVLAPPMLYALLDSPRLGTTDCSSLRVLTCGGSPLAPSRVAEAIDRLGPVLRIVYAMSESPGITELNNVSHDPAHPERLRSAGLPYGDVRVEVRDAQGRVLRPGRTGEIWVSSVLVTDGYWGEPELTRRTLVDGWLRTGDLGYKDADGYLYVVDRADDMILTGLGSTNVYTRPIEDALMAHPAVRAAAVIGVPHDRLGQAPYAYVVLAEGAQVTGEDLRARVAAALNDTWTPVGVEFVPSLPLVAMGKADKQALRERYRAGVADG
jgi:fatty-acyl-CoA synthase